MTKQEFVKQERYLKLNDEGDFIIDYDGKLDIIDFHTHMSNVLPLKVVDPNTKGNKVAYKTLPPIEKMDLSVPYWTKIDVNEKRKGIWSVIKFSLDGYSIFKDMANGGTYENCFRSQQENSIKHNVVLPLSTKKSDRSMEALKLAKEFPERFTAFCSVHPQDPQMEEKIKRYKKLGFKGLKLKISDMELKDDFEPLIQLLKACYSVDFTVLLHTGSLTHIKQENTSNTMWKLIKSTRVELFGDLLKHLPHDFKFVFGHSGIAEYQLVAKYMKAFPGSYAELSCQSADSIRYLMEEVGYERLIFGSDWPALPQAITLSRVLIATEHDDEARNHMLYKNAKKLLGL
ncbi:amidohydrolase family protein [Vallitalea pronyensis]|uniref:Amidohydrolase family protein n=1 Tax=Vallitalea pronyensis TaxID=1348613 RepID=A0A8J8SJ61_9FIRM|nr:amidohydrolase family protein [Vallitalea pronyensis]QUI25154.1 amidohydrolase family protein [Vallitalea pronyensis]